MSTIDRTRESDAHDLFRSLFPFFPITFPLRREPPALALSTTCTHNLSQTSPFFFTSTLFPTFPIPNSHQILHFFFDNYTLLVQSVVASVVGFLRFAGGWKNFGACCSLLGLKVAHNLLDKIPDRNSRCLGPLLPPLKLQAPEPHPPKPLLSSGRSFLKPNLTSTAISKISKLPNGRSNNSNVGG